MARSHNVQSITHLVIPDTQVAEGVPLDHLTWIGQYIVDHGRKFATTRIIHLGDHATMESLSSYDKGTKRIEGKRYRSDIGVANRGWAMLNQPLVDYNRNRVMTKHAPWWPDRYITLGNHEDRITRASEADAQNNAYDLDDLDYAHSGWIVVPYLEVLKLDGLLYSHYFVNNSNGRPVTGMIETRVKSIGASFIQGHQQGLKVGMIENQGGRHRGIVAGSCYLHSEEYRGPQAQAEWRGILVLHGVADSDYDLMEVSLSYLCRRYEGVSLKDFMRKKYPMWTWMQ